mmetsp:Transcript_104519/g.272912  ORF Transcript_104519/g.272912 Transcript_104519/m.272912 type:complete len:400 (-) Transcript_104519:3030-4229(-)
MHLLYTLCCRRASGSSVLPACAAGSDRCSDLSSSSGGSEFVRATGIVGSSGREASGAQGRARGRGGTGRHVVEGPPGGPHRRAPRGGAARGPAHWLCGKLRVLPPGPDVCRSMPCGLLKARPRIVRSCAKASPGSPCEPRGGAGACCAAPSLAVSRSSAGRAGAGADDRELSEPPDVTWWAWITLWISRRWASFSSAALLAVVRVFCHFSADIWRFRASSRALSMSLWRLLFSSSSMLWTFVHSSFSFSSLSLSRSTPDMASSSVRLSDSSFCFSLPTSCRFSHHASAVDCTFFFSSSAMARSSSASFSFSMADLLCSSAITSLMLAVRTISCASFCCTWILCLFSWSTARISPLWCMSSSSWHCTATVLGKAAAAVFTTRIVEPRSSMASMACARALS